MYPRLEEWRRLQRALDPDGVMRSDLARRTGLLAAAAPLQQPASDRPRALASR